MGGSSGFFSVTSLALLLQISLRYGICPAALEFSLTLKIFQTHGSILAYLLITAFTTLSRTERYLRLTASVETLVMH